MTLNFMFGMNFFIKIFIMSENINELTWKSYEKAWLAILDTYNVKKETHLIPRLNAYAANIYLSKDVKKL